MGTAGGPRFRAFFVNFSVGILAGFCLSYLYLGAYLEAARAKVRGYLDS